jgi:hypothetical protein
MPTTCDEILEAALQLSEDERLLIVNRLLETLPEDLPGLDSDDPGYLAELERRSGDLDGAVPWEVLREEFRQAQ